MNIVYFGSSEFGIPSLEAIQESDHRVVHVFTQPAHRAGRGKKPRPTPVAIWAGQNDIPCAETENINAPDIVERIAACKGDLLVVIAFGQKVGNDIIGLFPAGAVNVHASLLPEYRGAAPINRAIIDGRGETGISIITLAEKMDAGAILAQAQTAIAPDDNAQTLHEKLAQLAPPPLLETIGQIEAGTAQYTPQDESKVTWTLKLKKTDGLIDFNHPAGTIVNKIRGLWPWPGAQATLICRQTGKQYHIIIAKADIPPAANTPDTPDTSATQDTPGAPGTFDEDFNVICAHGRLRIVELKPAGKKLMAFEAFKNGRNIQPGDRFGDPATGS